MRGSTTDEGDGCDADGWAEDKMEHCQPTGRGGMGIHAEGVSVADCGDGLGAVGYEKIQIQRLVCLDSRHTIITNCGF